MTVLEAIQKSSEFLEKKGVESPRLNAELLLAAVLKLPRMRLYLEFERQLTEAETNLLREHVLRRGQREPLQHITGSAFFLGHEILVNRHVLVPRPETELLAEAALEFLRQSRLAGISNPSVLDIGTGSGCLAIAVATGFPEAQVTAVDISDEALQVAESNVLRLGLTERIRVVKSDLLSALPTDARFHLILSNPPYVATAEIETLDPEVRNFDPRLALDGGPDGLSFYRRLATDCAQRLTEAGKMIVEFGDGQAPELQKILECQNWVVEQVGEDYTRRQRILTASRLNRGQP